MRGVVGRPATSRLAPHRNRASLAAALVAHEAPVFDSEHAVGHEGDVLVVGDYDERLLELAVGIAQELHDLGRVLGVEVARGLVGEHDGRGVHERAADCHTLLLTA